MSDPWKHKSSIITHQTTTYQSTIWPTDRLGAQQTSQMTAPLSDRASVAEIAPTKVCLSAWWRHGWHGHAFPIFRPLREGNPSVTGGFHSQRTSNAEGWYICLIDVSHIKLLNKQSHFRWPETLWRSCDVTVTEIILCMHPANGRRRYNVTSSLIGWAHTQNDPYCNVHRGLLCDHFHQWMSSPCLPLPTAISFWASSRRFFQAASMSTICSL